VAQKIIVMVTEQLHTFVFNVVVIMCEISAVIQFLRLRSRVR